MKINSNISPIKTVRLGALNFGTVFKFEGRYYLVARPNNGNYALNLSDGNYENISTDTQVQPLPGAELLTHE